MSYYDHPAIKPVKPHVSKNRLRLIALAALVIPVIVWASSSLIPLGYGYVYRSVTPPEQQMKEACTLKIYGVEIPIPLYAPEVDVMFNNMRNEYLSKMGPERQEECRKTYLRFCPESGPIPLILWYCDDFRRLFQGASPEDRPRPNPSGPHQRLWMHREA